MNDFHLFDVYRRKHTRNNGTHDYCDVDHLLRFWADAKSQYLTKLFGDNLILEKEIFYKANTDEIADNLHAMVGDYRSFLKDFEERLAKVMDMDLERSWWRINYETPAECVYYAIRSAIYSVGGWGENVIYLGAVRGDAEKEVKSHTIIFPDGSKVQLQRGMKLTRVMTQLCKHLGLSEQWEQMRIAHSQIMNVNKIHGTLCLSIHPLDYATASDNENGWSSCMSWNDEGCYRMGTVEMMNSPMVICAYLKSNKVNMSIENDNDWNSKKWRCWVIVNKDVILCNRNYPYHHNELAKACIEWVRELVGTHMGWTYGKTQTNLYQYMRDIDCNFEFDTNYMYNDLGGDDIVGCLSDRPHLIPTLYVFSGKAECMVCGDEIKPDAQEDSGCLECVSCYNEYVCSCCGSIIGSEEDCYYDPDGNVLCSSCYDEKCCTCECCDITTWTSDSVVIGMPISNELINKYMEETLPNSTFGYYLRSLVHGYSERSTIPTKVICEGCASHLEFIQEFDGDYYNLIDPNKVSMEKAYVYLTPFYWPDAEDYIKYRKDNPPAWMSEESKANYELIYRFWIDAWNDYKTYVNQELADD